MLFNRKALCDAIQLALDGQRAKFDQDLVDDNEKVNASRIMWCRQHTPTWRIALASMNVKLGEGKPIVDDDIPRQGRYSESLTYKRPPLARQSRSYQPPQELIALLTILNATEDETVSTAALKQLGFGSFRDIMPYLRQKND